jgi:hypothetical protein
MNNEATNIACKTKNEIHAWEFMLGNSFLKIHAWKLMLGNTKEGRHGITRLALQVIGIAGVFTHSVVN